VLIVAQTVGIEGPMFIDYKKRTILAYVQNLVKILFVVQGPRLLISFY